jgi:DNA-binding IclR family transcriptional regulator
MIQVLHRAFDILEMLAKDREKSFTLSEIANQLSLNHATCANILKTMVQRQYIEQLGPKKGYHLGAMAYSLTGNLTYRRDLLRIAEPAMQELGKDIQETVILAILREEKRVLIGEFHSDHDIQVRTSKEKNAYDTATGRLLIAWISEKEQQTFIRKHGLPPETIWPEVKNETELEAAFLKIKADGFATQVSSAQIIGLAVPVRRKEEVVAALGVFLPVFRNDEKRQKIILEQMLKTADQISRQLI